jgi:AmiR/NasT family two-component response regulator
MDRAMVVTRDQPEFGCFPMTGTDAYLVLPLQSEDKLAGALMLAWNAARELNKTEEDLASSFGKALAATMREVEVLRERLRTARQENALLEKKLEERKFMERAKGLLQAHYNWKEENAYYHLRRLSRQQRIPMAVVSQRVIEMIGSKEQEV